MALQALLWQLRLLRGRLDVERGQGLVEYGLLIGLIAIALVGAVTALGDAVSTVLYGDINDAFSALP